MFLYERGCWCVPHCLMKYVPGCGGRSPDPQLASKVRWNILTHISCRRRRTNWSPAPVQGTRAVEIRWTPKSCRTIVSESCTSESYSSHVEGFLELGTLQKMWSIIINSLLTKTKHYKWNWFIIVLYEKWLDHLLLFLKNAWRPSLYEG